MSIYGNLLCDVKLAFAWAVSWWPVGRVGCDTSGAKPWGEMKFVGDIEVIGDLVECVTC